MSTHTLQGESGLISVDHLVLLYREKGELTTANEGSFACSHRRCVRLRRLVGILKIVSIKHKPLEFVKNEETREIYFPPAVHGTGFTI